MVLSSEQSDPEYIVDTGLLNTYVNNKLIPTHWKACDFEYPASEEKMPTILSLHILDISSKIRDSIQFWG